jgi:myosin-5
MFDRTRVTKLRYENSAIILQKYMRRHLCNKHLRVKRRAAVVFQCVWRCKMAKREMYRRKAAAKETGALLTAKVYFLVVTWTLKLLY